MYNVNKDILISRKLLSDWEGWFMPISNLIGLHLDTWKYRVILDEARWAEFAYAPRVSVTYFHFKCWSLWTIRMAYLYDRTESLTWHILSFIETIQSNNFLLSNLNREILYMYCKQSYCCFTFDCELFQCTLHESASKQYCIIHKVRVPPQPPLKTTLCHKLWAVSKSKNQQVDWAPKPHKKLSNSWREKGRSFV